MNTFRVHLFLMRSNFVARPSTGLPHVDFAIKSATHVQALNSSFGRHVYHVLLSENPNYCIIRRRKCLISQAIPLQPCGVHVHLSRTFKSHLIHSFMVLICYTLILDYEYRKFKRIKSEMQLMICTRYAFESSSIARDVVRSTHATMHPAGNEEGPCSIHFDRYQPRFCHAAALNIRWLPSSVYLLFLNPSYTGR